MGIFLALVTISASVGALQISLERGAMHSTAYTLKLKEIQFFDNQIQELQDTAKKQKGIDYITKSVATSNQATVLIDSFQQAQADLNELRLNRAGLNTAL